VLHQDLLADKNPVYRVLRWFLPVAASLTTCSDSEAPTWDISLEVFLSAAQTPVKKNHNQLPENL